MALKKLDINPGDNPLETSSRYLEDDEAEVAAMTGATSAKPVYYIEDESQDYMEFGSVGTSQKTSVIMKDPNFRKDHHMQWVDEEKVSEYIRQKFQYVRKEWVASSWASTQTGGENTNESDKVRLYVGVGEHGQPRYNVLMFVPMYIYQNYLLKQFNDSTLLVNQGEENLAAAQKKAMGK